MWTAFPPSEYYGLIRLPKDPRFPFPSRFRSPTCPPGLTRLGAGLSLWVRVSPSVPSQPRAMRVYPRAQESMGSPKFFDAPLHACHALMTPAGLQEAHQCDSLAWASRKRTRSPPASLVFSGLCQTSGGCGPPYGLHGSLCTLQTFRSVRLTTLLLRVCNTRYEWLVRPSRQGLAPCKKRQACLGAQERVRRTAHCNG